MKKLFVSVLFCTAVVILNGATLTINPTEFRNYKVGEDVTFKVTAKGDDGTL